MLPRRRRRRAPKGAAVDVSAGGGSKGRSGSLIRVGGVEAALYNHSWYGEVLAELAEFNVDSAPVFTASATYPNATVATPLPLADGDVEFLPDAFITPGPRLERVVLAAASVTIANASHLVVREWVQPERGSIFGDLFGARRRRNAEGLDRVGGAALGRSRVRRVFRHLPDRRGSPAFRRRHAPRSQKNKRARPFNFSRHDDGSTLSFLVPPWAAGLVDDDG